MLFCLFCTLLDLCVWDYSHICKKHTQLHTLRIQIGHFQIVRRKSLRVTRSIKVLSLTPASVSGYKPGFAKNRSICKTASEKYQPRASLKARTDRALNNPCPKSYSFSVFKKLINKPLKGSQPPQLPNPRRYNINLTMVYRPEYHQLSMRHFSQNTLLEIPFVRSFPECWDSNPGLPRVKHKCYLCAILRPLVMSIVWATATKNNNIVAKLFRSALSQYFFCWVCRAPDSRY